MLKLRKSGQRGYFNHGWLKTYHSFSFAEYQDPANMGFRSLRVINEDEVDAGEGFGTHPHRDMEIITYLVQGALEHKDSMGNGSVIRAGEIQYMSAGKGVTHSEFNPSPDEAAKLLQIWIFPAKKGGTPRYDQKLIEAQAKHDKFKLLASGGGRQGSIQIGQDADLYASILAKGKVLEHTLAKGRGAWLQLISGGLRVQGASETVTLEAGDGLAVEETAGIAITSLREGSEFLLFDLA